MNQYIITDNFDEDLFQEGLEKYFFRYVKIEPPIKKEEFIHDISVIARGCVRSHPYQSEREKVPKVDYERANEVRKRTGNVPIQKQSCRFQEIFDYGHYIVVVCGKSYWNGTCEHQIDCQNDQYIKYCRYALGNSTYPADLQQQAGDP
jgi:hypothetical protein